MALRGSYTWPKTLPELTAEQINIRDDFMRYWHEQLAGNSAFGALEEFNHGYSVKHAPRHFLSTLEIGAGLGEHLEYEKLTPEQRRHYVALELRQNMVDRLKERFPEIQAHTGDCQKKLDFVDHSFDRILAVHVLEHLPDLPRAVSEMYRLCNKKSGTFSVVIPCEGGLSYGFCRLISSARMFQKRYNQSYTWFIDQEHLSTPDEICQILDRYFMTVHKEYFPFKVPSTNLNLCIGMTLKPKSESDCRST